MSIPEQALARARVESRGLRIIWFGHSLVLNQGDSPIDLPATVDAIHESARSEGRSDVPPGLTRTHYDGPHDLRYWYDGAGKGPEKLRADDIEWDHVIGIGFMHMVGKGRRHPHLYRLLGSLRKGKYDTYRTLTPAKYQWIREVGRFSPHAAWLNYVGPRTADYPHEQPFVDERFECIRRTAVDAGARVDNVPVGRAFRAAEEAASRQSEVEVRLQLPDHLHLTKQGEFLAANVFFDYLYGADPTGLPVPPSIVGQLVPGGDEAPVALLLQRVAHETVEAQRRGERPTCRAGSRLKEDEWGRQLLLAP